MARIGVTGHIDLTPPTEKLVRAAIRDALLFHDAHLIGVSCIAAGADTIFAEVVLQIGGELEVILPAADYRTRKVRSGHAERFDRLINQASNVRVIPYVTSNRDAYEAANEALVAASDQLIAVWDGHTSADKGGTGAVVQFATSRGVPVETIWPPGSSRSSYTTGS